VEQADHTVAIEELVVGEPRRELRVRVHTMIGAMQLRRQFALNLDIMDVTLETHGAKRAGEHRRVGVVSIYQPSSTSRCGCLYPAGAAFRRTENCPAPLRFRWSGHSPRVERATAVGGLMGQSPQFPEWTMETSMKPPFRADQVGSLLRPAVLAAARAQFKEGALVRRGAAASGR